MGLHRTRLVFPGILLLGLSSRMARLIQQRGGRAVASMLCLLPTIDLASVFLTIHLFSSSNFMRSSPRLNTPLGWVLRARSSYLTLKRLLCVSGTTSRTLLFPKLLTLFLVFCCLPLLVAWECISPGSLLRQAFWTMRRRTTLPDLLLASLFPCGKISWQFGIILTPVQFLSRLTIHKLLAWYDLGAV